MLFRYLMFKILMYLHHCLDGFTSLIFGYSLYNGGKSERAAAGVNYENSAHVQRVLRKRRKFELEGPKINHFLLRHERYAHPDIILSKYCSLMGINRSEAIFSICDKDVYSHTVGPFLYINQFNHCSHLVRLPLKSFILLGDSVGDPPSSLKLVILSNTGRCGSTLLTQLFEGMPNTVAVSEPEVLMEFTHEKTFDDLEEVDRQKLLRTCLRLIYSSAIQSKPKENIKCIIIKPKAHGVAVARDLAKLYPDAKHLYMYRHPVEYVKSLRSVYKAMLHPIVRNLMLLLSVDMNMEEFIMRQFVRRRRIKNKCGDAYVIRERVRAVTKQLDLENLVVSFAALFAGNLLSMKDLSTEEGIVFLAVSYHELKDNIDVDMKRILKFCQLENCNSVYHLPENDSQIGSSISRGKLKSYQAALVDEEIAEIDDVLCRLGLPQTYKFPIEADNLAKLLELTPNTPRCEPAETVVENSSVPSSFKNDACLSNADSSLREDILPFKFGQDCVSVVGDIIPETVGAS